MVINRQSVAGPGFPSSDFEEGFADEATLQPADVKLLTIAEGHEVGATRHRAHPLEELDIGDRSAGKADESRRIQSRFEIVEPVVDRELLVPDRRQFEQLSVGDDRGDLPDGKKNDIITAPDRDSFEPAHRNTLR